MHPVATFAAIAVGTVIAGFIYFFSENNNSVVYNQQRRPPPTSRPGGSGTRPADSDGSSGSSRPGGSGTRPADSDRSSGSSRGSSRARSRSSIPGDCPICLEYVPDSGDCLKLKCCHLMHLSCYNDALNNGQRQCPICRAPM